jgi:hypothetical protein
LGSADDVIKPDCGIAGGCIDLNHTVSGSSCSCENAMIEQIFWTSTSIFAWGKAGSQQLGLKSDQGS